MAMQIGGAQYTGKEGAKVSTTSGTVRRLRIPKNGKSVAQIRSRSGLASLSTQFRGMSAAEQASWKQAALNYNRSNRAGMAKTLTGLQLFVQTNGLVLALKEQLGDTNAENLSEPPVPQFVSSVVLSSVSGALVGGFSTELQTGERLVIYASRPQSSGTNRSTAGKLIAYLLPEDITENMGPPVTYTSSLATAYAAKFGTPPAGTRIFFEAYIVVAGEMVKRPAGSAYATIS